MTLAHNVQFRPFHLMSFRMNTKMKISPRPQASPRPPPGHLLQSPDTQGQPLLVAQAVETRVLRGGITISWELQGSTVTPLWTQ